MTTSVQAGAAHGVGVPPAAARGEVGEGPAPSSDAEWITLREAALRFGLKTNTIRGYARESGIPGRRVPHSGGYLWNYRADDLALVAAARKRPQRASLLLNGRLLHAVACPRCDAVCHLQQLDRPGAYRLLDKDGAVHSAVCIGLLERPAPTAQYRQRVAS